MTKTIAVLGTGYVGLVSGTCFADVGNRVICCDIDAEKIRRLEAADIPIYEPGLEELVRRNAAQGRLSFTTNIPAAIRASEIIYIAVGTPMSESGEADLQYVRAAAMMIAESLDEYKIIVMKSTVPVGTCRWVYELIGRHAINRSVTFDVVSNPEFLREGSAIRDCMNMDRAVIGATSEKAKHAIAELHAPFNAPIVTTDLESAEMIKYASNAFLATKISFINAIANLCERLGADVEKVSEGMGYDSRIGNRFLNAGIGFGGSCFPKDTEALRHISRNAGYDFKLLDSVIETNLNQKKVIVRKLIEVLGNCISGKRISVLGLAFKPETNDMRYAPSLDVIEELLEMGAIVQTFDPVAAAEARKLFGERISYHNDVYGALYQCDAAMILTEWKEIVNMELSRAFLQMRNPILIDGRNCYDLRRMEEYGFVYHSIGRPGVQGNKMTVNI